MECLRLEERFGITAILIEPGFFRTDFLDNSSVSYGDIQIEEYAAWSAETRAALDARNHQRYAARQRSGQIFNISSMAGYRGDDGYSIYAASKFAVTGFSESLSAELAEFGIHITAVEPGFFR